jgi:uncharacterized protein (TIGR02996 family)
MGAEEGFIRALKAAPTDGVTRLVYADWLEEQGDCRAEYLRVQLELLEAARTGSDAKDLVARYRQLRASIDPNWVQITDWPGVDAGCSAPTTPGVVALCPHCRQQLTFRADVPLRQLELCGYCLGRLMVTVTPGQPEWVPGYDKTEYTYDDDPRTYGACTGSTTIQVKGYFAKTPATVIVTPLSLPLDSWSLLMPRAPLSRTVPSNEETDRELGHNLVWIGGRCGQLTGDQVRSRIRMLKAAVPRITRALRAEKLGRIVSLYALGSALWEPKPNDIDLVVVVAEDRSLEVLPPLRRATPPLHLRVVGLTDLAHAVHGVGVGAVRLHYEIFTLYATAVRLAGHDLFEGCRVPPRNLLAWLEYFRLGLTGEYEAAAGTSPLSADKRQRWQRQLATLEAGIARQGENRGRESN